LTKLSQEITIVAVDTLKLVTRRLSMCSVPDIIATIGVAFLAVTVIMFAGYGLYTLTIKIFEDKEE